MAVSLPEAPLDTFRQKTRGLPRSTEAERLTVQRIGQDIFREALMQYWNGRCTLTGITEPELLRASHIRAWADCTSDEERLDVHNGLLLSALWDAAFDRHLVSFEDDGTPKRSSSSATPRAASPIPRWSNYWSMPAAFASRFSKPKSARCANSPGGLAESIVRLPARCRSPSSRRTSRRRFLTGASRSS